MRIFEILESESNDVYKGLIDNELKEIDSNFKLEINSTMNNFLATVDVLLSLKYTNLQNEFLEDIREYEETINLLITTYNQFPDQSDADIIAKLSQCNRAKVVIEKQKQKLKDAGLLDNGSER